MTLNLLFSARADLWPTYEPLLKNGLHQAGIDAHLATDMPPGAVDYVIYAPNGGLSDFTPFTGARAVLSLWAGVETIVANPTLTLPLARMVDHGLTQGMTEWVLGHVLRYHLGLDAHIRQFDSNWTPVAPPLAQSRQVTVLGLGALGTAAATALAGLGFAVTGWSRSPKSINGITCLWGPDGLRAALRSAEILVALLPATPATDNLLDAGTLAMLPPGARILNPGRGSLIDDAALLAALDSGQVAHATLDVFRTEPLPPGDPYWAHPKVTVTPHIASETRPETAARVIVENIRRGAAGRPLLHLVDREQGY